MKTVLVGLSIAVGLVCGAQAHAVVCTLPDAPTIVTDHVEYTLTVDGTGNVELLGLGYFSDVPPIAGTFYLKDSLGDAVAGWTATAGNDEGFTQHEAYVANGSTVIGYNLGNTGLNVFWQNTSGANLGVGTYTFGYSVVNGTYALGEVAMYVLGNEFSNDNWDNPVNSGQAPVHNLQQVPEPTSFALLGLGAAVLALRRRVRKA
jgi:hypothetical protein